MENDVVRQLSQSRRCAAPGSPVFSAASAITPGELVPTTTVWPVALSTAASSNPKSVSDQNSRRSLDNVFLRTYLNKRHDAPP